MILGGDPGLDGLAAPIVPGPASLFGPRGACLAGPGGPLFVCDTGHHRVLGWHRAPATDGQPADFVLGQPDFSREGRNAKGEVTATSLNVPTGIAAADGILAVADAWNHRVLLWFGLPERGGRPADVVLGQADFSGGLINRGSDQAAADTLNWCYGVAIIDGRLLVADTGNRRVLVWDTIPTRNGTPADLVLGQRGPTIRDENAGAGANALGMRWPHGIAMLDGRILVADAGDNRVMVWNHLPRADGVPCDFMLGQADMAGVDHNRAAYYPTAGAMNMPYGLAVLQDRLVVADTASSRLLGFEAGGLAMGAEASRLAGQASFGDKGDNRWGFPARDSLCWPYNVAACENTLVVADSGNNRILLWEAAP
ncbi:NHL repeat-containing protein [Oleomonas cavernae]|uniref:NHL repeat-containing protein n=1 Tax=Oleomonas cavernae TaxID=2320859 RepID=UPI001F441DC2|nr:NHL repeat-containing protein [Oleomonas cavernae]